MTTHLCHPDTLRDTLSDPISRAAISLSQTQEDLKPSGLGVRAPIAPWPFASSREPHLNGYRYDVKPPESNSDSTLENRPGSHPRGHSSSLQYLGTRLHWYLSPLQNWARLHAATSFLLQSVSEAETAWARTFSIMIDEASQAHRVAGPEPPRLQSCGWVATNPQMREGQRCRLICPKIVGPESTRPASAGGNWAELSAGPRPAQPP